MKQGKDVVTAEEVPNKMSQRELPGYKVKKAAVTAALDIRLARMHRSPERCARNLMELGICAFPGKLTKDEQLLLQQEFMLLCRNRDIIKARELFFASFLS
jgi:hypothetical protein